MNTFAVLMVSRILEPIFLGCISNVIVNILFNPKDFHFIPGEFLIACVLAALITEMNHYVDRQLNKRFSWLSEPTKRLTTHFFLMALCLLVVLNIVGIVYMWSTGSGFFSSTEMMIINSVVFALAIILTAIRWSVQFYSQWVSAEVRATQAAEATELLRTNLNKSSNTIEIQQGTTRVLIEANAIRLAKVEFGTVRLYGKDGEAGIFSGTLTQLYSMLPEYLFFQASRDAILHRDIIRKTTSSTFGKVLVTLDTPQLEITVSRPKAAMFRKWLNSNSTING